MPYNPPFNLVLKRTPELQALCEQLHCNGVVSALANAPSLSHIAPKWTILTVSRWCPPDQISKALDALVQFDLVYPNGMEMAYMFREMPHPFRVAYVKRFYDTIDYDCVGSEGIDLELYIHGEKELLEKCRDDTEPYNLSAAVSYIANHRPLLPLSFLQECVNLKRVTSVVNAHLMWYARAEPSFPVDGRVFIDILRYRKQSGCCDVRDWGVLEAWADVRVTWYYKEHLWQYLAVLNPAAFSVFVRNNTDDTRMAMTAQVSYTINEHAMLSSTCHIRESDDPVQHMLCYLLYKTGHPPKTALPDVLGKKFDRQKVLDLAAVAWLSRNGRPLARETWAWFIRVSANLHDDRVGLYRELLQPSRLTMRDPEFPTLVAWVATRLGSASVPAQMVIIDAVVQNGLGLGDIPWDIACPQHVALLTAMGPRYLMKDLRMWSLVPFLNNGKWVEGSLYYTDLILTESTPAYLKYMSKESLQELLAEMASVTADCRPINGARAIVEQACI
jgi:hypothetical protein